MRLPLLLVGSVCFGAEFTVAQQEEFLRKASIEKIERLAVGVTQSMRVRLTDGVTSHNAHLQSVDFYKFEYRLTGYTEFNFRDCWKYNVAAYRLAKLLGITDMVPVSVERKDLKRGPAALTWWVDDVIMDEGMRRDSRTAPPDLKRWGKQIAAMHVFDQLIYNMDRNFGNLLITNEWKIKLIDHTRGFREHRTLRDRTVLTSCEPELLQALLNLSEETLRRELLPYVSIGAIKGLLARRDLIVAHFRREQAMLN